MVTCLAVLRCCMVTTRATREAWESHVLLAFAQHEDGVLGGDGVLPHDGGEAGAANFRRGCCKSGGPGTLVQLLESNLRAASIS